MCVPCDGSVSRRVRVYASPEEMAAATAGTTWRRAVWLRLVTRSGALTSLDAYTFACTGTGIASARERCRAVRRVLDGARHLWWGGGATVVAVV